MPTATLKEIEKELGVSADDMVQYEKMENEVVIRIQLQKNEKPLEKGKTAKEILDYLLENAEPLDTTNWAEEYKESQRIK
jgi:hypothetical protein